LFVFNLITTMAIIANGMMTYSTFFRIDDFVFIVIII
jgi:hypothetical protein